MSPETGLAKVHSLYTMQIEVMQMLNSRLTNPDKVKEARKTLKEFSQLLKEVDWRYMGGEDVYESFNEIKLELDSKLKKGSLKKN